MTLTLSVKKLVLIGSLGAMASCHVIAQSPANTPVLQGLAAVTTLPNTPAGQSALGANYAVTAGIQNGMIRQTTLLPFAEQQQQALKDAFITGGDFAQVADGLGTTLGGAYVARAHYVDRTHFTNISPKVAAVIAYANGVSGNDSNAGKYLFANGTTEGKTAVSEDLKKLVTGVKGHFDVFGESYSLAAGLPGADPFGDSRPFQTEPKIAQIVGPDYFNTPSENDVYNNGPVSSLVKSPSYPSGHTTYGYTASLVLAILVPERYQQMVARGAEYGNSRILMGAHYAMDVLGGRTTAMYDMAHLLANDPKYMRRSVRGGTAIEDFQAAMKAARADVTAALEAACGKTVAECAREDTGRLSDDAQNAAFYASTQTYGLPVVYPETARTVENVGKLAPEAGYLLTAAFPALTLEQADDILTRTEGPGGGFLDDGSAFGVYSRLNLYAAAGGGCGGGGEVSLSRSSIRARWAWT